MIMIKVIVVIIVLIVLIVIHIPLYVESKVIIVIKKLIDKIPLCYKMCV